ncbi:MAG: hypothetical protein HYW24_03680 [Candidatus Aenigmarchaeota archaeon]|nr:hypothetical protein [Candidatus Aenigmarchaeota archaeon]
MRSFLIALLSLIVLISPSYAHTEIESVDSIMDRMMSSQNVSQATNIDCIKIPDHEFEELGDSAMDKIVGDAKLHEQMDIMMGGEGSESLKQMHIVMGKNWLGCDGFQGMMGTRMMPMMMRMMGNYYPAYYSGYSVILLIGILGWILFFVTLIFALARKSTKKR